MTSVHNANIVQESSELIKSPRKHYRYYHRKNVTSQKNKMIF